MKHRTMNHQRNKLVHAALFTAAVIIVAAAACFISAAVAPAEGTDAGISAPAEGTDTGISAPPDDAGAGTITQASEGAEGTSTQTAEGVTGTGTPAAGAGTESVPQPGSCTVRIIYEDQPESGKRASDPIVGAEFTFYRVADIGDINSQGRQLISGVEVNEETDASAIAQAVQEAYGKGGGPEGGSVYRTETGADGSAVCGQMDPGIYLCVETGPAENHFASAPFLLALPYTSDDGTELLYTRQVQPKSIPAGELQVSKKVSGSAGEKNREFHFRIEIGEMSAETKNTAGKTASENSQNTAGANEGRRSATDTAQRLQSLHFTRSDGTGGQIENGGTLALADGQSAVIDMLPAGAAYRVSEVESGKDGYTTKSDGDTGVIRRTVRAEAVFTNSREKAAEQSRTKGQAVQTGDSFLLLAAGAMIFLTLLAAMRRKDR